MKYLGIAKKERDRIVMPDGYTGVADGQMYEALDFQGDILLLPSPIDRARLDHVDGLAKQSIAEHRTTLKGLAR